MGLTATEKIERLENLRDNLFGELTGKDLPIPWMCNAYNFYYHPSVWGNDQLFEEIPEILKYKPRRNYKNGTAWWSPYNKAKRVEVINKTIEDIKATL